MGRESSSRTRVGRFATPFVVLAVLVTGPCAVPVANATGPTITVTPHTGLVSGQTVTVVGTGFFAGEELIALECPRGSTDPFVCDFGSLVEVVANTHGRFSTTVAVRRTIVTDAGFSDCAPSACEMVFADGSNFSDEATAPLRFDASVALPKTSVTVTPATGLGDRQTVTISGKGFTGDRAVLAVECVTGSFSCLGGFFARANVRGGFSIVGSVHRNLFDVVGNPVDCAAAAGTCEMVAYDPFNADYHGSTSLAFDPDLPPPPPPTAKVDPADNLPFYARVSVHGRHWSAGDPVLLMECPNAADAFDCFNILGFGQAAADGTLSVDPMLHRKLVDAFSGTAIDCAKRNRCVFVAEDLIDGSMVTVPVTFDPAAPIPPRPRVNLNPDAPYTNHQIITVKGRNFAPNATFNTTECFSSTNVFGCFLSTQADQFTDANGDFATQVKLHRLINLPGETIDCADAAVACELSSSSEGGVDIETPLQFSASAAAGPAIDASPVTSSTRLSGWAAALPAACSGMRLPPRIARQFTANPRQGAEVCGAWRHTLQG
jgi:hypothetical protein